jgi:DNA-binding GntR family transcriptional regulator
MELQLASQLGVSRTPIREAIRMLEQEGLAITVPRKGAEVAKMTLKGMEDVLEIREALDELAVQLACERISDEQLKTLKDRKQDVEISLKSGKLKAIAEADVRFHEVIYEATGNPKLMNLLSNLREQIYRYRVEYLKKEENYQILIGEHEAIYQALVERNADAAVAAIHEHVKNQAYAVKEVIIRQG